MRGMFVTFPEDARWNAERQAVEFAVEIGEYGCDERPPNGLASPLFREQKALHHHEITGDAADEGFVPRAKR